MDPASRHLLWAQAHHERPILGGLGDHLSGHRGAAYESFVRDNALLHLLERLGAGDAVSGEVTPESVKELIEKGFTSVVVDPIAFGLSAELGWYEAYAAVFEAVWGPPERQIQGGAMWQIQPVEAPVPVSAKFRWPDDREGRR